MGVCHYCGAKAGWFGDVHDACVSSAQKGCEVATSFIFAGLIEKPPDNEHGSPAFAQQLWADTKPVIDQLATVHRIPADQLREALRKGWSQGAEQVATTEPMNPTRLLIMNNFYRAMGFTDEEMRPTDGFVAQVFSTLLVVSNGAR